MEIEYKALLKRPVILKIVLDDVQVPLRGRLLRESGETIRIRVGEGWDIDVYKTMISAVEEADMRTA